MPTYFQHLFLFPLTIGIIVLNQGDWKQMPVMAFTAMLGYAVTVLLRLRLVTEVATLCGTFVLGCLVNLYSSIRHRSAAEILIPGLLVQVPSALAAHGSLVRSVSNADVITHLALDGTVASYAATTGPYNIVDFEVAWSMARVAIAIAVGLRLSAWTAYVLGQRRLNCWSILVISGGVATQKQSLKIKLQYEIGSGFFEDSVTIGQRGEHGLKPVAQSYSLCRPSSIFKQQALSLVSECESHWLQYAFQTVTIFHFILAVSINRRISNVRQCLSKAKFQYSQQSRHHCALL